MRNFTMRSLKRKSSQEGEGSRSRRPFPWRWHVMDPATVASASPSVARDHDTRNTGAPSALKPISGARSIHTTTSSGANLQTTPSISVSPLLTNTSSNISASVQGAPPPSAPPPLWAKAYARLSPEDKDSFASLDTTNKDYSVELTRHIEKHRHLCQEKRWKFDFRGKKIIIRDVVERLLVWVDKFKSIGDIVIQYDPGHAALPWAGVRFLLQLSICDKETMGVIITGVETITRLLVRCRGYEDLYLSPSPVSVHDGVEASLINLYVGILEFLACAKRYLTQTVTSRVLRTILASDGTSSLFDAIEEKESLLEKEIKVVERKILRSHQTGLQENYNALKLFLKELEEPIKRIDDNISILHFDTGEYIRGKKRLDILNWLSGVEYKSHHEKSKEGMLENTGQWLFNCEEYQKWRSSSASEILWLHGIPGAGKTKLTCTVIETLISQLAGKEPVVYFYCNKNDPQRQDPKILVQAILKQLSITFPGLPKAIVAEYDKRQEDGMAAGTLSFQECQDLIIPLLDLYPEATIVIDALDEINPDERGRLLELLKTLLNSVGSLVKIFVSSRDDMDIKLQLEGLPNLYINAKDTRGDIHRFVEREIDRSIKNKRLLHGKVSKELGEYIKSAITQKSNGMFQWADLQVKSLLRLKLASEVEKRLIMLPDTLEETYSRVLNEIRQGTPNECALTERSLMWILASKLPLDRQRWAEFSFWPKDVPEDGIDCLFDLCRNLATWDRQLDRVIFPHLSVQEYLEKAWLDKRLAFHSETALACISAMSFPSSPITNEFEKMVLGMKDFLSYSLIYWFEHIKLSMNSEGALDNNLTLRLRTFLGTPENPGEAYKKWNQLYCGFFCQGLWCHTGLCRDILSGVNDPYSLIAGSDYKYRKIPNNNPAYCKCS